MRTRNEPGPVEMRWVRKLAPRDDQPVPVPVSGPDLLTRVSTSVGPHAVAWAAQVGAEAAENIIEEMPYFGPDQHWRELLRMGTESATLSAVLMLASADGDVPPLTDEARSAIIPYVENGISLDQLLRGIRFGHAGMSAAFLDACAALAQDEERAAAARLISARLFDHIDRFAREAAEFYKETHQRFTRSSTSVIKAAVEALVAGKPPTTTELAALSYSLDQHHRAIVVTKISTDAPGLPQVAHDALRCLGTTTQLIVPVSDTVVWAWGGTTAAADRPPATVRAYPGVQVAIGPILPGRDGFRRSHLDAMEVAKVQQLSSRVKSALAFDDVEMVTLLIHDLPAATRFVRRILGPLAAAGEQNEDLRSTVKTYLDVHGSPSAAAQRLHLARNTVSARVQRTATLLQREIGADCADLHCALILADTLGEAVLETRR